MRLRLTSTLVSLAFLTGCTTSRPYDLPDVVILVDGGIFDTGIDGGFPDPVIDPCEAPGSTIGHTCGDPTECDDGCYCNGVEQCTGGVCVAGSDPCEDEMVGGEPMDIPCTVEACFEETDTCLHMPDHSLCSNGLACDGYERCDPTWGCVAAAALYCNDGSSCTVDSCDDATGCVFAPRDLDGDGFIAGSCGGDDCDDDPRFGALIHPGAPEVCDNRRDDDCDGGRDFADDECHPTNDTCETATILPSTDGTVRSGTYSGSTSTLGDHYPLACATSITGPDAVFRFSLAEPHDVRIGVSGISGAAVAIRELASCAGGPDVLCTADEPPSTLARNLPSGEYAIVVRTATGGVFDLQVTVGDPTTTGSGLTTLRALTAAAGSRRPAG